MDIYFGRERHNSISIRINIRPDGSPGIESFANGADGFGVVRPPPPVLDLNDR
jgi:hypothetical protein